MAGTCPPASMPSLPSRRKGLSSTSSSTGASR
jgi:hypothetical protein